MLLVANLGSCFVLVTDWPIWILVLLALQVVKSVEPMKHSAPKEEVAMGGVQAKEAERDRSTATIASQHCYLQPQHRHRSFATHPLDQAKFKTLRPSLPPAPAATVLPSSRE